MFTIEKAGAGLVVYRNNQVVARVPDHDVAPGQRLIDFAVVLTAEDTATVAGLVTSWKK